MSSSKEQSNLQKRTSLLANVKTDLPPFTGIPANSLTATQSAKWASLVNVHHGRLVRMLFKASARNDSEEIKDSLDTLTAYYVGADVFFTNLELSGQVNPAHDGLMSVLVQLATLLVEGFPNVFNNKDFTIFWQLANFYKKHRKAEAEAKKAEADARKALLDKKAQDAAKLEVEARELAKAARSKKGKGKKINSPEFVISSDDEASSDGSMEVDDEGSSKEASERAVAIEAKNRPDKKRKAEAKGDFFTENVFSEVDASDLNAFYALVCSVETNVGHRFTQKAADSAARKKILLENLLSAGAAVHAHLQDMHRWGSELKKIMKP